MLINKVTAFYSSSKTLVIWGSILVYRFIPDSLMMLCTRLHGRCEGFMVGAHNYYCIKMICSWFNKLHGVKAAAGLIKYMELYVV
jgi:hypothetical protein